MPWRCSMASPHVAVLAAVCVAGRAITTVPAAAPAQTKAPLRSPLRLGLSARHHSGSVDGYRAGEWRVDDLVARVEVLVLPARWPSVTYRILTRLKWQNSGLAMVKLMTTNQREPQCGGVITDLLVSPCERVAPAVLGRCRLRAGQ
jgi:hypothetical protein